MLWLMLGLLHVGHIGLMRKLKAEWRVGGVVVSVVVGVLRLMIMVIWAVMKRRRQR